ncbi:ribonuclease P/MRP protein subunit POP1 [Pseudohyphozyma bogoriensis]|nr:ribonuclease P/MRP protein subunit POP1 [Pseudohyphozyma bogoriensis]
MAPKRPQPEAGPSTGPQQLSGPERKRARMREQRTIPVQGDQAQGRPGGSRASGNNTLPPILEPDKFADTPDGAAKPKKTTRKMRGRVKGKLNISRPLMLMLRQRNKIWLETHIWHAKRMHMTEIWGHRLALKPTEKAFRSSHRASHHGCMIHDASYFQYIELSGAFIDLKWLLDRVTVNQDPTLISAGNKRYSSGARELETLLHSTGGLTPLPIGPATIIWCPISGPPPLGTEPDWEQRKVLLRLHPSICIEVSQALSVGNVVLGSRVAVRKCEKEYSTFEVVGKRAVEVVKGALKCVVGADREKVEAWKGLSGASGPGGLPKGMVFGLEVYDPRLSYPPRLDHSTSSSIPIPSAAVASSPKFWSAEERAKIRKPKFRKVELDERRSKLLLPGSSLAPLAQDDRIPLLLSTFTLSSSTPSIATPPISGLTLTIPAGWSMPFWMSLVHSQPRIAGILQRSQYHFEAGVPRFPEDFPGCKSFAEAEVRREQVERGRWERRPPAKRHNFQKSGDEHPWMAGKTLGPNGWVVPAEIVRVALGEDVSGMEVKVTTPGGQQKWVDVKEKTIEMGEKLEKGEMSGMPLARVVLLPESRGAPEELGVIYTVPEGDQDPSKEHIIGRVTSGSYSLSLGHGYAVGCVKVASLLTLGKDPVVMVRNRGGEIFRKCRLFIME